MKSSTRSFLDHVPFFGLQLTLLLALFWIEKGYGQPLKPHFTHITKAQGLSGCGGSGFVNRITTLLI